MNKKRDQWSSKLGFIFAAAGSAVGLGNIWKFPGKAYAGGGGVYLVVYLLIVALVGLPVMVAELTMGRNTQKNFLGTFRQLNKKYMWIGLVGVAVAAVIFCYYLHVGGWVMSYIFTYLTEADAAMEGGLSYFYEFLGYNAATGETWFPVRAVVFPAIFTALNAYILVKGISGGIEKFNKIGMPALFVLLIILMIRSVTLPAAQEGVHYMLSFDLSKLNGTTVISALGQAFYSLSLGMAIMLTYGSYLSKDESIPNNTVIICSLDTLVAFIAGFIIVPAVFATLGPDAIGKGGTFAFGPLGGVFKAMPFGGFWGFAFYLLLFFAAISSSISIGEALITFACEELGAERKKFTIGLCTVAFCIGIFYTISQAAYDMRLPWIDFTGIKFPVIGDWMEYFTDRLVLPVCALGESIFVGWVWKPDEAIKEATANGKSFKWAGLFTFCIKYLAPAAIAAIIVYSFVTGTTIS